MKKIVMCAIMMMFASVCMAGMPSTLDLIFTLDNNIPSFTRMDVYAYVVSEDYNDITIFATTVYPGDVGFTIKNIPTGMQTELDYLLIVDGRTNVKPIFYNWGRVMGFINTEDDPINTVVHLLSMDPAIYKATIGLKGETAFDTFQDMRALIQAMKFYKLPHIKAALAILESGKDPEEVFTQMDEVAYNYEYKDLIMYFYNNLP
jgi:hypothetical protein